MVLHYPPARLRRNSDQPTAITDVLINRSGSSSRTGDIPLGSPTCSARTRQGRWALYPNGDQVVVVWPGGALVGPAVEVAQELDRLRDDRDDLDRAAVRAIRQFLTDPATADGAVWSATRARTWSSPAVGYWLSGPTNQPAGHHTHPPASRPGAPTPAAPIPLPDPSPQPTPARAA